MSFNPVSLENLQHSNSIAARERAARVALTRQYLVRFPNIKARFVAARLGVNERSAYRYLREARDLIRQEGQS